MKPEGGWRKQTGMFRRVQWLCDWIRGGGERGATTAMVAAFCCNEPWLLPELLADGILTLNAIQQTYHLTSYGVQLSDGHRRRCDGAADRARRGLEVE